MQALMLFFSPVSVTEVRKKWKGLRDIFRREYKKVLKSGDEAPEEFYSSWPFFNQMKFLSDIMDSRTLKGNITSPEKIDSSKDEEGESTSLLEEEINSLASGNTSMPYSQDYISTRETSKMGPPTSRQCKRKKTIDKSDVDNQFLEIEKAKLGLFAEKQAVNKDSDYQFLVSLLPFLQRVPSHRKLSVRNKIQQVLIDEEEARYTSSHQASFSHTPSPSSWSIESTRISNPELLEHGSSEVDTGIRQFFQNFPDGTR